MNHKQDYTKLEDQGWNDMKNILDKNMPNKKKRFAFYYPFALGAIVLFFIAFYSISEFHKRNSKTLQSTALTDFSCDSIFENFPSPIVVRNKIQNSGANLINPSNKTHAKNSIVDFKVSNSKIKKQSIPQPEKDKILTANKKVENESEFSISQNIGFLKTNQSEATQNSHRDFFDFAVLPGILANLTWQNSYPVLNPISYVPVRLHYLPQTPIRKFEFGIHSGIKFDTKLKYSAYSIGTHIGYNLNQKWSLSVSPTLNIEQGNFLILNDFENTIILSNLDSFKNSTTVFTNMDSENFDSKVGINNSLLIKSNKLYNLQFPLTVNYKIKSNWQACLGIEFSLPIQKLIHTSQKNNILQWKNQTIESWNVKSINYNLQAGIRFFPIKSFGISLDYIVDIFNLQNQTSILKTSSTPSTNIIELKQKNLNHLTIGLLYKF
ncbi:MAG: hypothetical protein IPO78_13185 [Saprospiraceae bacterium]|nr:hypothetical protein [Saprospiraceae bacterium]MBK9220600.1 hypothetical protein [Saprospiraceae bacterium]MBK9722552.1 hypothetical protein [Saprospiraceae bacterium]